MTVNAYHGYNPNFFHEANKDTKLADERKRRLKYMRDYHRKKRMEKRAPEQVIVEYEANNNT